MNIAEAKDQIRNALRVYFKKDAYGNYRIPPEEQRPVFLMGPPGIGKTAIVQQVASELGVGLISYSMTHHTRQSALGLPLIEERVYGGKKTAITEYTMSEIIASVYDLIEQSGAEEGILFLDEINCVSETLTPIMLQFLQYKQLGTHHVPDGWLVVAAGNPPEYNRSARDFDIVTWDRVKRVDIDPDYQVFRAYAWERGVHASVISYLDIKTDNFYHVETGLDGMEFVTARGWEDLSRMLILYEENGIDVDRNLIGQYLQAPEIAEDFAIYYDLFRKYREDYAVQDIVAGTVRDEIAARASEAPFDERLSLIGLLMDEVSRQARGVADEENLLKELHGLLLQAGQGTPMDSLIADTHETIRVGKAKHSLSAEQLLQEEGVLEFLQAEKAKQADYETVKADFAKRVAALKESAATANDSITNALQFADRVWSGGQELLLLVTEVARNAWTVRLIGRYGNKTFQKYSKRLMLKERGTDLVRRIEQLSLNLKAEDE